MPSVWQRLKTWLNTRVVEPFVEYVRQDAEPKLLARSAAVGFFLGLCPVVGVSAGLCLLVCFLANSCSRGWLSLHTPMVLLFNFVAMPVELLLIVPLMRLGEVILRAQQVHVIPKHFSDLLHPGEALKGLAHALLGWVIICLLLVWPVALVLSPLFALLRRRYMSMRRVDSDHGPLMENQHHSDGSISDVELTVATPSPTSPIAQARGSSLSPRSNSGPSALSKLSPHV